VGTGLTGTGMSMVVGTEKGIRILTRSTLTRLPARYICTHVQHKLHQQNQEFAVEPVAGRTTAAVDMAVVCSKAERPADTGRHSVEDQ
jgi:hypothetical protein